MTQNNNRSTDEMENEAIRQHLSLEPFFETSPDVLCIAGFDGYFKKVNPAFEKLLGYTQKELYNRPINDFVHEKDKHITHSKRNELKQNVTLRNFENRYVKKSGEFVWLSWTSIPLYTEELVYAIAKDITHLKKLEEERNQLLAHLSRVNRNLKFLSYSASHDLRSPVANMQTVFELLDLSKIQDEETLEILDAMGMATYNLKKTLNNYLDVLEKDENVDIKLEVVNFEEVYNEVCKSIESLIEGSQANIKVDFSAFEFVKFGRIAMESIFLNLITNSIKYSRPDAFPEVSIFSKTEGGKRQLVFRDNGKGFDQENFKDKIFGLHQKFSDNDESKGIGLYLVHSNVSSMGGNITVESKPNQGTTFTISFAE